MSYFCIAFILSINVLSGVHAVCQSGRKVKPGDSVFLTIDDGPSFKSRRNLLSVFKEIDVKVTFFESGYNVCNDLPEKQSCASFAYKQNVVNLAMTVKDGHMLAAHSDNHYFDTVTQTCSYLSTAPDIRPAARFEQCGTDPIQNMVQGAHQIQLALQSSLVNWTSAEEKRLQQKAIKDVWTYSRLPCSDIWRTRDVMYAGQVECRPDRFKGIPWENYGFDPNVDWKGDTILDEGEVCRMVKLIEDSMEEELNPLKKGKLVLLTHGYYFDTEAKAQVFKRVAQELLTKGYMIKTIEEFHKPISNAIQQRGSSPTDSSSDREIINRPSNNKKFISTGIRCNSEVVYAFAVILLFVICGNTS